MRISLTTGLTVATSVTTAAAVPLEGTWTGVYTCAQGATPPNSSSSGRRRGG